MTKDRFLTYCFYRPCRRRSTATLLISLGPTRRPGRSRRSERVSGAHIRETNLKPMLSTRSSIWDVALGDFRTSLRSDHFERRGIRGRERRLLRSSRSWRRWGCCFLRRGGSVCRIADPRVGLRHWPDPHPDGGGGT